MPGYGHRCGATPPAHDVGERGLGIASLPPTCTPAGWPTVGYIRLLRRAHSAVHDGAPASK